MRQMRRGCLKYSLGDIMYVTNESGEKKILGKGGEGSVYLAEIYLGSEREKTLVAAKHLGKNSRRFEQEIKTVSEICHDHLVSLLGYCEESDQKILLYEYMRKGSLKKYVQEGSVTNLSWVQLLNICLGAARGLQHLHTSTPANPDGIIHRDVKPGNILLDENWVAKVADFGALKLSNAPDKTTRLRFTPGYLAPEYGLHCQVTTKIDVYSFGAVMFQVLCRKMPRDRPPEEKTSVLEENENLALWAQQNVHAKLKAQMIPDDSLKAFTAIIGKSLQVSPQKRIMIDDVIKDLQKILEGLQNIVSEFSDQLPHAISDQYSDMEYSTAQPVRESDTHDDQSDPSNDRLEVFSTAWGENCRRFSLEEIEEGTNNWKIVIWVGGTSIVYLADCFLGLGSGKTKVAVKVIKKETLFNFSKETSIISRIQHPHVVSLIGYCMQNGRKMLVYEYMKRGSLSDCLKKRRTGDVSLLTWKQWLKICIGTAQGLLYLHTETNEFPKGIIHRDVNAHSILLDQDWVAKVSGFGFIKPSHAGLAEKRIVGTVGYFAPECLMSSSVTRKVDVYSFAVVLCQVLCGKKPWDLEDDDQSFYVIDEDEYFQDWAKENVYGDIKEEISEKSLETFTLIIGQSLRADPRLRPTMYQVVSRLEDSLVWQEREDLHGAKHSISSRDAGPS